MIDLTFVIPFLNEERSLQETCVSVANQDLGSYTAEVIFVDGMSSDSSREIIDNFVERSNDRLKFRIIENPDIRTPFGFNLGIENASGEVIGFGGSHTIYPSKYFATALDLMDKIAADVVGGGHENILIDRSGFVPEAMGCLYLSPMGSAVAAYHRRKSPGFVDTVYGGFYRRAVFDRVGKFDTRLEKNQDNEFNSRVIDDGLTIYFDPKLSTDYTLKADFRTFLKRPFQFGRFHPETWRINPRSFTVRHAIPFFFTLYLILLMPVSYLVGKIASLPALVYALLLLMSALFLMKKRPIVVALATIPLFFVYHVSYGLGTIAGLASLVRGRPSGPDR